MGSHCQLARFTGQPGMRLTVVFITAASLCLCVGEDTDCILGEQCTPTDKCPDYLVKRRKLDTYTKSGAQYHLLLGELKSQICNQAERKVCCSQPAVCGLSQLTTGFIIGGKSAEKGEFPFMALIGEKRVHREVCLSRGCHYEYETRWNCGGNIIHQHWVLTAAHCKPRNQTFVVRLGEHILEGVGAKDPDITDMEVDIQAFIIHQQYEKIAPFRNDIALIRLPSPARPSQVVQVVCLPMEALSSDTTKTGMVVGWGKTSNNQSISTKKGIYSEKQQKLEVPILIDDCPRTRIDHDSQICAGGEKGKDSCNGDSGGGLFWREGALEDPESDKPWYLIGIVSFGSRSCGVGRPAVYTRVSAFLDWIQTSIETFE